MKNTLKTVLVLLLAAVLVFAVAACDSSNEDDTTTTTTTTTISTLGNNDGKPDTDNKDEVNTDNKDEGNTDNKDEGNTDNKDEGNTDGGDDTASAQIDIVDGTYVLSNLVVTKKDSTDSTVADIELLAGDEKAAQSTEMGKLVYWNDQNWCGSTVTVDQAVRNGNEYTFAFTHTGECWYGFQIFYNPVGAVNGETYNVSFVIKSDVDAKITVCGTVYTLVANEEQTVSYEVTLNMIPEATDYIYGQSAVSIQFGVEGTAQA